MKKLSKLLFTAGLFAVLLTQFAGAALVNGPVPTLFDCSTLFGQQASVNAQSTSLVSPALAQGTTYSFMLEASLFIILLVLSVLGLVYAIGYAFNISKLMTFVKNEYLECIASILIVVVAVGGIQIFNNALVFLANLSNGLLPTSSTPTNLASTQQVFQATCENLESGMITTNLYDYGYVLSNLFFFNALQSFTIKLMPNEFGVTFQPWGGIQTLKTALWSEEGISFTLLGMGGLLIMFLFVIYYLFPIFFYVGILLRSFPWTRAAGGAMIALFISFYIIFPALVYPFSSQLNGVGNYVCAIDQVGSSSSADFGTAGNNQNDNAPAYQGPCTTSSSLITSLLSEGWTTVKGGVDVLSLSGFGSAMYDNVTQFSYDISDSLLQVVGIAVAFIIAYDMLEALGDVLGSPSLQSGRILSKVI